MIDVILSLVRTAQIGYLRDIRRLTVALSRARLGLYILGRRAIFESVPELKPAFDRLFSKPAALEIVMQEMHPTTRKVDDNVPLALVATMTGVEHLGQYVYEMTQAKIKNLQQGKELPEPVDEQGTGLEEDEDQDDVDIIDADLEEGGEEDLAGEEDTGDTAPDGDEATKPGM